MRSAAAHVAVATTADAIDINMGCPVPKVRKSGAGAALLDDPDLAVTVTRAARGGTVDAGRELPITVKLRSGLRPGEESGFALAHRLVEEAGAAAIAFHPALGGRSPQGSAGLRARRAPGAVIAGARDPDGRPRRRRPRARGVRRDGRGRGDARARVARATPGCSGRCCPARARVGMSPNPRAQRSWTSCGGRSTAPSSTSASLARPGTCASSTRGTWHASGSTPPRPSA